MRSRIFVVAPTVAVGICLAGAACAERPEPHFTRTTRADTVFVHNGAAVLPDTLLPRFVSRVGVADGPLENIFNQIYAFAVGSAGDIYVHDEAEGVRRYDPDGRYVGHVARRGEGPGEVRYLTGLAVEGVGEVAAYDWGNRRITVFSSGGGVRTAPTPDGYPPYIGDGISFHDDGSLWVGLHPTVPRTGGIPHPRPIFARLAPDGALTDTIWTVPRFTEWCPTLSEQPFRVGFWEDKREPYIPKVAWSLGPGGTLAMGCPAEYSFDVFRKDGRRVVVSRAWEPLPTREEVREFQRTVSSLPVSVPPTRPAYARLVLPGDGRIWVWPNQPLREVALSAEVQQRTGIQTTWLLSHQGVFDVFTAAGRWLAVVRLPPDARYSGFPTEPNVVIRGDTIWAVSVDSLDAQSVARYQVDGLEAAERRAIFER